MYCPECGNDAGDAKFCPECGADLRGLESDPVCDACGSDMPDGARFCPECGEATGEAADEAEPEAGAAAPAGAAAAGAAGGGVRRTGTRGRSAGATQQRRQQPKPQQKSGPAAPRKTTAAGAPKRLSPAVIWGGFGLAAVIVILVVVLVTSGGGSDGATPAAATTGSQSVQPVSADTSGSYDELVQRANGLYDEGAKALDAGESDQGAAYFAAAAKVYAAAWKQQSTDPGVGTDFATSLFYSGQIKPAISQVERVLTKAPTFQTAWFNKGNYLAEKARQAEQDGEAKVAEAAFSDARVAYEQAVSLDADSASGQQAQDRLDELPQ